MRIVIINLLFYFFLSGFSYWESLSSNFSIDCSWQSQDYYFQEACDWDLLELEAVKFKGLETCELTTVKNVKWKKIISFKGSPDFIFYQKIDILNIKSWNCLFDKNCTKYRKLFVDTKKVKTRCSSRTRHLYLKKNSILIIWWIFLILVLWYYRYKKFYRKTND